MHSKPRVISGLSAAICAILQIAQVGDAIYSAYQGSVAIASIELVKESLTVYALEVDSAHNFFVGNYGILVHNMFFPELINLSAAMAPTLATGATIGGCFGPITFAGGVALGGVIGIAAKIFSDKVRSKYLLHFDIDKVAGQLKDHKVEKVFQKKKGLIDDSSSCAGDPEDPDGRKKYPHGRYEDAPYHHINSKGSKNPCPKNGQVALDRSLLIKKSSPHRISIDNGEFVVLKQTREGLFHGYTCGWKELSSEMQKALLEARWVSNNGKILLWK